MKTIAGRLVRELERNLPVDSLYHKTIDFFKLVLAQNRSSKNKIYSLHEPDVLCISKGKEHKKYEFGNKVSIVMTQNTGVIVGAMGFRNEFDGHTLTPALEQVTVWLAVSLKPQVWIEVTGEIHRSAPPRSRYPNLSTIKNKQSISRRNSKQHIGKEQQ